MITERMCIRCTQHPRYLENDGMGIIGYQLCRCCMVAFKLKSAREEAAKIPALEEELAYAKEAWCHDGR